MLGAAKKRRLGLTQFRYDLNLPAISIRLKIMADRHEDVKKRMDALYEMLVEHDGYGEMSIDFRSLRKDRRRSSSTAESSTAMSWIARSVACLIKSGRGKAEMQI